MTTHSGMMVENRIWSRINARPAESRTRAFVMSKQLFPSRRRGLPNRSRN